MFIRLILLKDSLFNGEASKFFITKTDRCYGIQMKYITVYLNFWAVTVALTYIALFDELV